MRYIRAENLLDPVPSCVEFFHTNPELREIFSRANGHEVMVTSDLFLKLIVGSVAELDADTVTIQRNGRHNDTIVVYLSDVTDVTVMPNR